VPFCGITIATIKPATAALVRFADAMAAPGARLPAAAILI